MTDGSARDTDRSARRRTADAERKRRQRGTDLSPRACACCGELFTPQRTHARCCSARCRARLSRSPSPEPAPQLVELWPIESLQPVFPVFGPDGPPQLRLVPDLEPLEWEGLAILPTRGGDEVVLNLSEGDLIRPGEGFPPERYIGRTEDGEWQTDQGAYSTLQRWQRFSADDEAQTP